MNPFTRFMYFNFLYIQATCFGINVISASTTNPEETFLLFLNICLAIVTGIFLINAIIKNFKIKKDPEEALIALLLTLQNYPGISKQETINKLTLQYPLVPTKVFLHAFEQAIAQKYIGAEN